MIDYIFLSILFYILIVEENTRNLQITNFRIINLTIAFYFFMHSVFLDQNGHCSPRFMHFCPTEFSNGKQNYSLHLYMFSIPSFCIFRKESDLYQLKICHPWTFYDFHKFYKNISYFKPFSFPSCLLIYHLILIN